MTNKPFAILHVYNDDVPRSAASNMALDEALWETVSTPSLRMYEWDHPALSFGYFGRYQDVKSYQRDRELVRRCTGGGIVLHGHDLTYALVIPATHFIAPPLTVYGLVHQAIQDALVESGVLATLATAGSTSPNDSYICFANPVASDVLVDGVKVAGAAQRRSRRGLLQQGSIQNIRLSKGFRDAFARRLSPKSVVREIDHTLWQRADELAANKYQMESWLRRH